MFNYNLEPSVRRVCGNIIPTDIKVFYEDGKPYVYYKGTFIQGKDKFIVEIPKMDMVLKTVEHVSEFSYTFNYETGKVTQIPVLSEVHAEHEVYFTMEEIGKQMSKADIEKELGYKVDIVD